MEQLNRKQICHDRKMKPCPFCGKYPEFFKIGNNQVFGAKIICKCGMSKIIWTFKYINQCEANQYVKDTCLEWWNKRVDSSEKTVQKLADEIRASEANQYVGFSSGRGKP
jgi:hypothetical protein